MTTQSHPEHARPIVAEIPAPTSCCSTAKQEVCCEPAAKPSCCGTEPAAGSGCGCQ